MSDKKVKSNLKEKFISIYETFFKNEDFSIKDQLFWDELFLLKINSNYIINEIKNLTNDDLNKLKRNINYLYNKAITILKNETNPIRLHNIIQTLYVFTYSISINKQFKLNTYDLLQLLIGVDNAEIKLQSIFDIICTILINDITLTSSSSILKEISFKYLLTLVTLSENINENRFIEYFMIYSNLFEAIIHIISEHRTRLCHGKDALLLLTLLLQYQKYESENPYIVKLSILDDELALTGLAHVMSSILVEYNRIYMNERKQNEGDSWWNNFGTFIGNMFVGDEEKRRLLKLDDAILLIFYECVHLNRNFISTLTHAATEFTDTLLQTNILNNSNSNSINTTTTTITTTSSTLATTNDILSKNNSQTTPTKQQLQLTPTQLLNNNSLPMTPNSKQQATIEQNQLNPILLQQQYNTNQMNSLSTTHPSNLLVVFLETCSAQLQETKIESNHIYDTIKLFMIILVCISEDQYANSLIHDTNMVFSVFLYQAKHRHRKLAIDRVPPSRPLVCAILDLIIEFMQTHLMKCFPFELYVKAIGIIQRLMCYQKKYKIRLNYQWQNLWTCLINILKFLINFDSALLSKGHNIFNLCSKIVLIFNIFITYGDTFLPNPECYDYLYYDIMRMRQIFDNLLLCANRYASSNEWKDYVNKLQIQMLNVRTIINHFAPKIDAYQTANHVNSLTEQQVLEIVRTNYDSLTLKLEDNLDQYERYSERPHETAFFSLIARRIINEAHINVDFSKYEHTNILQELGIATI